MESAERKEHAADGQTGDENVQSDTAVELAGAASERDQAKEVSALCVTSRKTEVQFRHLDPPLFFFFFNQLQEHGSGSADASQAEGHDSTLMARMSSRRQRQKQTQVRADRLLKLKSKTVSLLNCS